MQKVKKIFLFISVFYFILLSGCQEASLWEPSKYNRNSSSFDKVVTDRSQVVICSASAGQSSRKQSLEKAQKECAKFGKQAVYQNYTIATCPLAQPVSWHYNCVAPQM